MKISLAWVRPLSGELQTEDIREIVIKQVNEEDLTLTRRVRNALAVISGTTCWHHPFGYRYQVSMERRYLWSNPNCDPTCGHKYIIVSKLFPLFAFVFPFQNRHQQKFSIYGLIMSNWHVFQIGVLNSETDEYPAWALWAS